MLNPAVKLRWYYLLWEFVVVSVIVYIILSVVAAWVYDIIQSTIMDLQIWNPRALLIVNGDFNLKDLDQLYPWGNIQL